MLTLWHLPALTKFTTVLEIHAVPCYVTALLEVSVTRYLTALNCACPISSSPPPRPLVRTRGQLVGWLVWLVG